MALLLAAGTLAMVTVVAVLLNNFGNRAQHAWYVSFISFVSWFFPFSIVVLVPLDLSSTLFRTCTKDQECKEPLLYVSSEFLVAVWRTIYWCSFALTWVLIPLLQAYTQSGEFSVMKRLRSAIRYNLIYQLIIGSIALLGLIYVSYSQGTSNLRAYVMALSNSWGLVLVVIFMGYGMVDVPRRLWHKGDNARELRRISFKASVVKDKRQDTEDEVLNVAKELSVVCHKVQLSDPLRPFVDQMVEDFPVVRGVQFESSRTVSPIPTSQSQRDFGSTTGPTLGLLRNAAGSNATNGRKQTMDNIVPAIITEKYLADLNARIKKALRMNDRWTAIWNDLLRNGFLAQDIQENADNPEKKFRSTLRPLNSKRKEWRLSFEWLWHLKLRPVLLRCLSVICAIMSLVIVWSETTYNHVNPILSVIGLLVQVASDRISYGAIEAVSFITMLYMCTCAYNTLLKMKLLSNYVLVPNHHTDEPSLLFFGSYLCRLTFPLVYNYLTISAVGKDDSTEFSRYMGKIDMVPFLGEFNYYMPYVILVPTLITLFNVFAKMFAVCSISDNFFDNDDDEGGIGGDLEEGQQVLKDARRDEERRLMPERQGLNRDFTARRGAAFENYNSNKNKNKNRNRNRNDNMTRGMLGEGSSTSAWRDLRPHPSGTNQRYHDTYYDDHSEDDDEDEDEVGGLGRREPDYYGGGSAAGRSSFDGPGRGGPSSRTPLRPPRQQESAPSSLAGGFKSVWQKFVKPKQPISLDEPSNPDMVDSDGARSSLESTGHDRPSRGTAGRLPNRHQPAAATTVATAASSRSGPALMFASVQQQSPNFSRSPFQGQDDRESLLSVPSNPSRPSHSNSSSRAQSPQGRGASPMLGAGKNSRPNSRVFGTSNPGSQQRTNDPSPRPAAGSRHGSPLINIFDDDDD